MNSDAKHLRVAKVADLDARSRFAVQQRVLQLQVTVTDVLGTGIFNDSLYRAK